LMKKAVALATLRRNGIALDPGWLTLADADLQQRLAQAVAEASAYCPDLFKRHADGALQLTEKGSPSKSLVVLRQKLEAAGHELEEVTGEPFPFAYTDKTNEISTAVSFWGDYRQEHP